MRIIFDRSAFHGARFETLLKGPLLSLSKQRRISIYHTPILLEETIRMYLKEKNREELRRQLPFIFEICQDRWLRDRVEIWVKELVEEADPRESVFMPDDERRSSEENIRRMVFDNDFDQIMFEDAKKAMDENGAKAGNIRRSAIKMRDDISRELKAVNKSRKDIKQTADQYVDAVLDETGAEIIKNIYPFQMPSR